MTFRFHWSGFGILEISTKGMTKLQSVLKTMKILPKAHFSEAWPHWAQAGPNGLACRPEWARSPARMGSVAGPNGLGGGPNGLGEFQNL